MRNCFDVIPDLFQDQLKLELNEKGTCMKWNSLFAAFSLVAMSLFAVACSNDDVAGGSSGDSGIVAIKDLDVAGVTQKGPFVKGSAVTVRGIDCKTLELSDERFEGEVKSDKGDFVVEGVSLKSSCAVFEVTGEYRSELSGKKTDREITLRALTDLENRKNVNVNILTKLEYDRIVYLVTEKGMSFAKAKAQAEKEVLAAFAIEDSFEEFENLNIFESGEGNAALLAVSVMMQGGIEVKDLVKRMDKFDESFAEKGVWNDSSTKSAIAEWVVAAAASGKLDSIRKNVEGWGIAVEVPLFEKFVDQFVSDSSDLKQNIMTDDRDGQTYRTVKIGNQVWMAENLNYKTEKSYCYNDSAEYCTKYGRLYEWNDAMRACPDGWHLPLLSEFKTLVDAMGDTLTAGDKLKSTSGWLQERNGTDDYGFSILPIGARSASGEFINKEWLGYLWSSTESGLNFAYTLLVGAMYSGAQLDEDEGIYNAFPIRCLQGENDSLKSVILVEDSAVAACKTENADNCEYGKLIDERDHQEYKTVKIGKQVWMAENLNYETTESYCYNDSAEYCTKYGRLYTWAAALKACPTGWHLPTRNEGMTLYNSVGGGDVAAKMLKSVDGWTENGAGTDSFGFTALAVGDRSSGGTYENVGRFTGMWTATEVDENYATHIHLFYMDDDAALSPTFNKKYAYSVRCVKDDSNNNVEAVYADSVFDWSVSKEAYLNPNIQYDSVVDSRDGQVYKTVKIGEQVWMAENLNYADSVKTPSLKGQSWCYDNDIAKCSVAGRLYTWVAAIDSVALATDSLNPRDCGLEKFCHLGDDTLQGICPDGWHLPNEEEWKILIDATGDSATAGKALKSARGWNAFKGANGNGSDKYGFSALPTGRWSSYGKEFIEAGDYAYFWTSYQADGSSAYVAALYYNNDLALTGNYNKMSGLAIRCVKD